MPQGDTPRMYTGAYSSSLLITLLLMMMIWIYNLQQRVTFTAVVYIYIQTCDMCPLSIARIYQRSSDLDKNTAIYRRSYCCCKSP